jgi:UDP:flavonoid glycosyltransferase YjiC (YdhE family)
LARAAVEALRGEPYRVLLTLSDALPGVGLESSDNIVVTRFVPHAAVLPHAALVITHGGMGITGKAAVAGVPQVVVPYGRDQPEIARRVSEAGIGVRLPAAKLDGPRLRQAVRQAIELQPRASAVGAELRGPDAADQFAGAVHELLRETERV